MNKIDNDAKLKKLMKVARRSDKAFLQSRFQHHFPSCAMQQSDTLSRNLDTYRHHHNIVHLIARAFLNQDIVAKTGYCFARLEPLDEIGSGTKGGKTFDVAIISEMEERLLLVEAKSTSSHQQGSKIAGELQKKIDYAKSNFHTLLDQVGMTNQIDWNDVEFVVCIEKGPGSEGLISTMNNRLRRSPKKDDGLTLENINKTSVWLFLKKENDRSITVDAKFNNHKSVLLREQLAAIVQSSLTNNVLLPFLPTDHEWIFLEHCASIMVDRNFSDANIKDKKKIRIDDLMNYVAQVAGVGAVQPDSGQKKRAKRAVDAAVKHGVDYKVLEKVDDDSIRLACPGRTKRTIIDSFKYKYLGKDLQRNVGQYATIRATDEAAKLTLEDYDLKTTRRLDSFDPQPT